MIKTTSLLVIIELVVLAASQKTKWNQIALSSSSPNFSQNFEYDTDSRNNHFEVTLQDPKLMEGKNLFVILESENVDFVVSVFEGDTGNESGPEEIILDLVTHSGNSVIAMSDSFFNGKFDFFKQSGILRFKVRNQSKFGKQNYSISVRVDSVLNLSFDRIYTTRIDSTLTALTTNLSYSGSKVADLQKVRFQITAVHQKRDFTMSASVSDKNGKYQLNPIFKKTVGGILSQPTFAICKAEKCTYTLEIQLHNVKIVNIESFLIGSVEVLSIRHFEEYYDRAFLPNKVTYYNLPYEELMEELDLTISLIPVTGATGLFVNAKTLPLNLENFDWKEKGPLAKRITIRWKELVQMRAEKSNLFIAVTTTSPGEYLIKVDAHEQGLRGRLNGGIIESGFVAFEETNVYLYYFDVFESQNITFDLKLNIVSGDADLSVKQCNLLSNCNFDKEADSSEVVYKDHGSQNPKHIDHSFFCEFNPSSVPTTCTFVIGVKGKENHGTHFEISLQETLFHRLMTPGHSFPLSLNTGQEVFLKFSYPSASKTATLFLSVEALWGSFEVVASKKETYPVSGPNAITEKFVSTKLGLYNSLRNIRIVPSALGDTSLVGIYYVAVRAVTSCSANLKFYERSQKEVTIHTLTAGHQLRAEIHDPNEVIYYTIKVSLENEQANSVSIVLTPLKGQFVMFGNRKGKLPTLENHELYSMNNHLELVYEDEGDKHSEYVIGVRLNGQPSSNDDMNYQFLISMTYSNKPLKLNPGIISQHVLTQNNFFLAEITPEMKALLILRSVVDGYNIQLCADILAKEFGEPNNKCTFTADDRSVSLFISEEEVSSSCNRSVGQAPGKCYLRLSLIGNVNQKLSIGFTFDDHPFQLTNNLVVTGPIALNSKAVLHFIYHPDPEKTTKVFFNSKGTGLSLYTKLIRGDHFDRMDNLTFPDKSNHDKESLTTNGYVTHVIYQKALLTDFGSSCEILMTVESSGNQRVMFDSSQYFILQASTDSKEILRTQSFSEHVEQDEWNYYNFYNNGNSDNLRIYASTTVNSRLEVLLTKGLQARPPFTNKAMFSKIGIGSVEINLVPDDLVNEQKLEKELLKGHYTVAVRSSSACQLNLFWNNKEDLNYLEITPNQPSSLIIDPSKALYFSFYSKENQNSLVAKGTITIYIKSTTKTSVYVLKSAGDLMAPSSSNFIWKGSIGANGGITVIRISETHPEYCSDCLYIGSVESESEGQVLILADVRHNGLPVPIVPGFTLPDFLNPFDQILYKVYNSDTKQLDLTVSILSGFVSVFISKSADVSTKQFQEKHELENSLDIHRFISIKPDTFGVTGPQDFYVLVVNQKKESASFTITANKNSLVSPIEPGVTKYLNLNPDEETDFIYTPKRDENLFEVRFEVREVFDEQMTAKALESIGSFVTVHHVNVKGDRFQIKLNEKSVSHNRVYINFDISQNTRGKFAINIRNPTLTAIGLSVDLLNGGYKLINFNEFYFEKIEKQNQLVYEGYGQRSKFLFVDVKVCHGDVDVEFFQESLDNVVSGNKTEFKIIEENNARIQYITMKSDKVFLRVRNRKEELSVFEMAVFNEEDLNTNPYSELVQGDKGRVEFETESHLVKFRPATIRKEYRKEFFHVLNYTVFLTQQFKVLKYLKNCGRFMLEAIHPDAEVISASAVFRFDSLAQIRNHTHLIKLAIPNLTLDSKYFGIVVVKAEMFPRDRNFITPVRTARLYYDEFTFISPKVNVPFYLLVSIMFCLCFFAFLFIVIKAYVFGQIRDMRFLDKVGSLAEYDETFFGFNINQILEEEYFAENQENRVGEVEMKETSTDLENDIKIDLGGDETH